MKLTKEQSFDRVRQYIAAKQSTNTPMTKVRAARTIELEGVRSVKVDSSDKLYLVKSENTCYITPADDNLPIVLGEFDFSENVELNPVLLDWLIDTANQVTIAQETGYIFPDAASLPTDGEEDDTEGGEPNENLTRAPKNTRAVSEYISPILGGIEWLQDVPYNNNLVFKAIKASNSKYNGRYFKCKVGCVPLAAAQVICALARHDMFRVGCVATPPFVSPESNNYIFDVPALPRCPKFDFNNMLDVYSHREGNTVIDHQNYTEAQANAVAELCAYIGMAGEAYYSPSVTGMWTIDQLVPVLNYALGIKATGYSPSDKTTFKSSHVARVLNSLRKGMPVIMAGRTGNNGHAFVCDGYDQAGDVYHFNWGYGPNRGNGWFRMLTFEAIVTEDGHPEKYESYKAWATGREYIIITPPDPLKYDLNKDGFVNQTDTTFLIDVMNSITVAAVPTSHKKRIGASIRPVWKSNTNPTDKEYVDLHLPSGTLWAKTNVGAETENGYGDYIAWRRTEAATPYIYDEELDSDFTVSDITGTAQDAAQANWGGSWQLPSVEDFEELKTWCKFTVTAEKTIEPYTLPNGRTSVKEVITRYVDIARKRRTYTDAEIEIYNQTGSYPAIPLDVIRIPLAGIKWINSQENVDTVGVYWTGKNGNQSGNDYYATAVDISFSIPETVDIGGGRIFNTTDLADLNYDGVIDNQDIQMIIDQILDI